MWLPGQCRTRFRTFRSPRPAAGNSRRTVSVRPQRGDASGSPRGLPLRSGPRVSLDKGSCVPGARELATALRPARLGWRRGRRRRHRDDAAGQAGRTQQAGTQAGTRQRRSQAGHRRGATHAGRASRWQPRALTGQGVPRIRHRGACPRVGRRRACRHVRQLRRNGSGGLSRDGGGSRRGRRALTGLGVPRIRRRRACPRVRRPRACRRLSRLRPGNGCAPRRPGPGTDSRPARPLAAVAHEGSPPGTLPAYGSCPSPCATGPRPCRTSAAQ